MPTPASIPLGSQMLGAEFLSPMTDRNGAEISAFYIESIPMPSNLFGEEEIGALDTIAVKTVPPPTPKSSNTLPEATTETTESIEPSVAEEQEPEKKPLSEESSETQELQSPETNDLPTEPVQEAAQETAQEATQETSQETSQEATQEAEQEATQEAEQEATQETAQKAEQEKEFSVEASTWELIVLRREELLEEELLPPPANPEISETILALLPMPEDEKEREVVQEALHSLSAKEQVLAMLYNFPGKLTRQDVQQDGTLLFEVSQTASGEMWNILLDHPKETLIGIQPYLYHKEHNVRLMALYLLQQLPYEELLIPLTRFLLDPDPAVAQKASQLVNQQQGTNEYRAIVSFLRRTLNTASGNRLARSIRLLTKLHDSLCVPDLIDLLEKKEPGLTQIVHAALIDITKQPLPPTLKKWNKWWRKVGSRTERIDWLIEGLQQKDLEIVNAAWLELREATDENFGFAPDAPKRQRNDAIKSWKRWRKQSHS